MCWTKLSCLLLVVATKSCRSISRSSRTSRPSVPTIVTDDLRPNGGLDSTTDQRRPGSAMSESRTSISESPLEVPMPWSSRFIAANRAVLSTSS